jgi:tRNA (cmo5U34)-methyltransferase
MPERGDEVWKTSSFATAYLEGVRAAIPLAQEQIDVMLRLIAASGTPRCFLDMGCGDGVLSAALLERFPEARGVLVDFSAPMLEAANRRFAGREAAVRIAAADFSAPAWLQVVEQDAPYDAVVSGYSIHHQPDGRKREVYREVLGLLHPGGVFINVEHVSSPTPWLAEVHDDLFVDYLHRYHSEKSREEIAEAHRKRIDAGANILAPVEAQCEWLREIGFADVDCYLKIFELAVFGGRRP